MANKSQNINGSGAPANTSSWTGWQNLRCTLDLPTGVKADNGNYPVWITAVRPYMGGRGGSETVRAQIGVAYSATKTFAANDGGALQANMAINAYYSNSPAGSTATLTFDSYGDVYYGWNAKSGKTISSDGGTEKSSATLTGAIEYVTVPTAPRSLTVGTVTETSVNLTWTLPSDTGGNYSDGDVFYEVHKSTSSTMSSPKVDTTTNGVKSYTATGLTPGTKYYFAVFARQNVTEQFNTKSVKSNVVNATPVSGIAGKRQSGSTFLALTTAKRMTGSSSSVNLTISKRYTGTSWVDIS